MNKKQPTYFESIMEAMNHYDTSGIALEDILSFCTVTRVYTNRLYMLNQIRLELRRCVDKGLLVKEGDVYRLKVQECKQSY